MARGVSGFSPDPAPKGTRKPPTASHLSIKAKPMSYEYDFISVLCTTSTELILGTFLSSSNGQHVSASDLTLCML